GIRAVEKELWSDTARRLLLLVFDHDVLMSGDALSIVGGDQLDKAATEAARPSIDQGMTGRVIRRRDDYIGWDTDFATGLTPWHFYVEQSTEGVVAMHLDAAFVLLAV